MEIHFNLEEVLKLAAHNRCVAASAIAHVVGCVLRKYSTIFY
ncbi:MULTISPECIES: hypothetical protein [Dolichospermum]|nr:MULTISPECIES: hypothetical protein [Dolichospermum]MDB9435565.1 hypothetical protein [Dolichospermum lemmermannii CS-548]